MRTGTVTSSNCCSSVLVDVAAGAAGAGAGATKVWTGGGAIGLAAASKLLLGCMVLGEGGGARLIDDDGGGLRVGLWMQQIIRGSILVAGSVRCNRKRRSSTLNPVQTKP